MKKMRLAALCQALNLGRARVERWITVGVFHPQFGTARGSARGLTFSDAFNIKLIALLVDAGFRQGMAAAIARSVHLYHGEEGFLLLSSAATPPSLAKLTDRKIPSPVSEGEIENTYFHDPESEHEGYFAFVAASQLGKALADGKREITLVINVSQIEREIAEIFATNGTDA